MADPIRNFFKSTLVGTYSNSATSLTIATGDGALLPDPSTDGAFNLTIFEGVQVTNSTSFEIVRVTAISGDVLTVTRGAESTTPLTIGSATHSILMSATKKTFDDIRSDIANIDLTTISGAESITFDTTGDEEFQFPAGTTAQRPSSPSAGYARYNTDTGKLEIYTGNSWLGIVPEGLVELGVATATVSAQDAEAVVRFFEEFGTPEAGYSVRKLGSVTNCIRVRRSNDNAEQDIGFTADGDLDESALTTFTGANDGFVTTWYDQSGNSNDATQNTAGSQPKIVSSGSVIKENSQPALDFDGTDDLLQADGVSLSQAFSMIMTVNQETFTEAAIFYDATGTRSLFFASVSDNDLLINSGTSLDSGDDIIVDQTQLYFNLHNSTSSKMFRDGVEIASGNAGSNGLTELTIGNNSGASGTNYLDGKLHELIAYDSDKSADRTDIESNIADYFNITI